LPLPLVLILFAFTKCLDFCPEISSEILNLWTIFLPRELIQRLPYPLSMLQGMKSTHKECKKWPFQSRVTVTWYVIPVGLFSDLIHLEGKLAVARANGTTSVSQFETQGLLLLREWIEPRLKAGQRYVGLAASSSACVVPSTTLSPSRTFELINQQSIFLHFEWRSPLHAVGKTPRRTTDSGLAQASV
jgi:hypothetical protein